MKNYYRTETQTTAAPSARSAYGTSEQAIEGKPAPAKINALQLISRMATGLFGVSPDILLAARAACLSARFDASVPLSRLQAYCRN